MYASRVATIELSSQSVDSCMFNVIYNESVYQLDAYCNDALRAYLSLHLTIALVLDAVVVAMDHLYKSVQ